MDKNKSSSDPEKLRVEQWQHSEIPIEDIVIGDRLRGVNQEKLKQIKQSMSEVGLLQPITVTVNRNDGFELVAGLHRLQAARELGWETIPILCFLRGLNWGIPPDANSRMLAQIDENLCRAELSPVEVADYLKRRKELFNAKGGATRSTPGGKQKVGFAKETAEVTGRSKAQINRAVRRAEKIVPEVMEEIKGTALDKGTTLDAIVNMSNEEQRQVVKNLRRGADGPTAGLNLVAADNLERSLDERVKQNSPAAQLKRLKREWDNADFEVREKFLRYVYKRGPMAVN